MTIFTGNSVPHITILTEMLKTSFLTNLKIFQMKGFRGFEPILEKYVKVLPSDEFATEFKQSGNFLARLRQKIFGYLVDEIEKVNFTLAEMYCILISVSVYNPYFSHECLSVARSVGHCHKVADQCSKK
jgi:hypothetical protein